MLDREKTIRFNLQERDKRDEREKLEKQEREDLETWTETVLATTEQVAAFRVQLDSYDAKTVDALMDNREAMEAVRHKMDDMLDRAEVLPDGRRVFKTMDGKRVFDEHGQELAPEVIEASSIDDKKPKWETYKDSMDENTRLTYEREQLIEYQTKLDKARARLDKGDITAKETDSIKADLSKTMPDAVREKLGLEKSKPDAKPEASAPALPDDMDNLMRKTGFAPVASVP
ncbi:hypothetical protein HGP16_29240 [Rhizobium sp. P40RR-XXII]|uniref:hypothetical protein n=1 Tax=unclassified Rhizobium TaxID=2613769 RepID=UPI00145767D8|nr:MULTISPECIES: hypothetical protein [unclassified Rhizobium]NLR88916.1 hypothetical protein [Rhizobium sp. P28RR-XV]NLS20606.1 hypothetical protein [Rhizobium sp. P40RR-XXII]